MLFDDERHIQEQFSARFEYPVRFVEKILGSADILKRSCVYTHINAIVIDE